MHGLRVVFGAQKRAVIACGVTYCSLVEEWRTNAWGCRVLMINSQKIIKTRNFLSAMILNKNIESGIEPIEILYAPSLHPGWSKSEPFLDPK